MRDELLVVEAPAGTAMHKRVLLVEDEPDIAALVRLVLQPARILVTVAQDLATARLVLAAQPAPDLVILDIGLPDGSGLDLCREIKTATPLLPVVVMTAAEARQAEQDAREAGADLFVAKPFDPVVVEAGVGRLLLRGRKAAPRGGRLGSGRRPAGR